MKVPAVKRYRTEIKKKPKKIKGFDSKFRRFARFAAGAAVGVAAYEAIKALSSGKDD